MRKICRDKDILKELKRMRENIFVQQELYEKQFLIATPKRKLADSIKIFRIHTFCDPEITHFGLLKQHLSMA